MDKAFARESDFQTQPTIASDSVDLIWFSEFDLSLESQQKFFSNV